MKNIPFEFRIEHGKIWVELDKVIEVFADMETDEDKFISSMGKFGAYTLQELRKKGVETPDCIMARPHWDPEHE